MGRRQQEPREEVEKIATLMLKYAKRLSVKTGCCPRPGVARSQGVKLRRAAVRQRRTAEKSVAISGGPDALASSPSPKRRERPLVCGVVIALASGPHVERLRRGRGSVRFRENVRIPHFFTGRSFAAQIMRT